MLHSFVVTITTWLTQNYPSPKVALFWADNLWPYHAKCFTQCFNLSDYFQSHFAARSVTYTYIFWPSIPCRGIYSHYFYLGVILVHYSYFYFISDKHINTNGCHTVMGLTITFQVNFMDSNMIPWFLSLNNLMISNVFMKFSSMFCHI